jgi:copper chaperone CopZ
MKLEKANKREGTMYKTIVKVDGMACGMCESHVNDAIRKAFDIEKVTSSHKKGETVIIAERPFDKGELVTVIEASGYDYVSSRYEPYEKKGLFGFRK